MTWTHLGASDRAVWGRYHGSGAEPYEVSSDHVAVSFRCTCPSRARPCKHVVGLLVMWVRGQVGDVVEPSTVASWVDRERLRPAEVPEGPPSDIGGNGGDDRDAGSAPEPGPEPEPGDGGDPDVARNERIARLVAGLVELDRWLEDRLRVGLADPSIARFATWDDLASRLVDARAGALANRVRRVAGRVGASSDWHGAVLAEMGILHLIACAGQRVPELPSALADTVAVACGWQVRRADVEASVPETDHWLVVGRSDVREDLVEVRRVWLRGLESGVRAMVLSFAAYRQSLDDSLAVGDVVAADIHRYPGSTQRAIVGRRGPSTAAHGPGEVAGRTGAVTVAGAFHEIGRALSVEPWLERVAVVVVASPTIAGGGGWALTDETGSMTVASERLDDAGAMAVVLAASGGAPVTIAVEWTPDGVVPLTLFLADRVVDIGPRADESFVSAA